VLTTGSALVFDGTNLGVGVASPAAKLDVLGSIRAVTASTAAVNLRVGNTGNSVFFGVDSSTGGTNITGSSAYATTLATNTALLLSANNGASVQATLDTSGNLGLGVTPSAWTAAYRAFDFGSYGSAFSNTTDKEIAITYNAAVVSGTGWTYKNTNQASLYQQTNGKHVWQSAASGTAGTSISWTTPMTLDASGNLGIGTTSPLKPLDVTFASGARRFLASYDDSVITIKGAGSTNAPEALRIIGDNIRFNTGVSGSGTEAARIDSSGNLLFGTTSSFAGQSPTAQFYRAGGAVLWLQRGTDYGEVAYFKNFGGTTVGNITVNASTTTYNVTSDYRLKTVIGSVTGHGKRIDALQPVEYTWNVDNSHTRGFLAHQFQEVYAASVTGTKDAVDAEGNPVYQSMQASTSEVIADLVAEIKSLRQRVAQLESN
jgi:hypothetical protein